MPGCQSFLIAPTDLVLGDGTDVGNVTFDCTGVSLDVTIDTVAVGSPDGFDYVILLSTVDLLHVDNNPGTPAGCADRNETDYINKALNPKIGTGDLTSTFPFMKSAAVRTSVHTFDLSELAIGEFCIALEARLFDVDNDADHAPRGPRHARGYLDGTTQGVDLFAGKAPIGYVFSENFPN
jgi:hypothetical protein